MDNPASLQLLLGLAIGIVLAAGGVLIVARLKRSAGAATPAIAPDPRLTPRGGIRALSLAWLRDSMSGGERPETSERELADDLRGYLGDVAAQHGADDAMLWIRPNDVAQFQSVAWNHDALPPREPWGTERDRALVTWAAGEGVVTFDTAEGPPAIAASRVPLESIAGLGAGGEATGALVLHTPGGIRGARGELRLWLPRHAERLAQLVELQVTRNEVARQNRRMRALVHNAQGFQAVTGQEALERRIAESMLEAGGAGYGALVRWEGETRSGSVRHATPGYPEPVPLPDSPVDAESLVGGVCLDGTPRLWEDASVIPRSEPLFGRGSSAPRAGALAILPLQLAQTTIGALVIGANEAGSIRPNDLRTARLFAQLAAAALEAAWEIEEVSRRSRTDALTGLWNRRHFDDRLAVVLNETDRFGASCALVLADLDMFKGVNDTYGHEAGDQVLKVVADVMRAHVRTTDTCARIGGEEFCAILPQTALTGALELAERLRANIEHAGVRWREHEIRVTSSFGVAIYAAGSGPMPRAGLFQSADRALYRAKREGKNCVRTESPGS